MPRSVDFGGAPDAGLQNSLAIARCDALLVNLQRERRKHRRQWGPKLQLILRLAATLPAENDAVPSIIRIARDLLAAAEIDVSCLECGNRAQLDYEVSDTSGQMDYGTILFRHKNSVCQHTLETRVPTIQLLNDI